METGNLGVVYPRKPTHNSNHESKVVNDFTFIYVTKIEIKYLKYNISTFGLSPFTDF